MPDGPWRKIPEVSVEVRNLFLTYFTSLFQITSFVRDEDTDHITVSKSLGLLEMRILTTSLFQITWFIRDKDTDNITVSK